MSTLLDQRDQQQVSRQFPMPTDSMSASSSIQTITGETVSLYYSNSGTRTVDAGQAAGTAVVGQLANKNIYDASGGYIASKNDTSLGFTGNCFTTEKSFPVQTAERVKDQTWANKLTAITSGFANGEYCVDYRAGTIYGVKATTTSSLTSTTYIVNQEQAGGGGGIASDVNIDQIAGADVNLDDAAFAVGTDGVLACGLLADEAATDSVDEGDIGLPRMTLNRRQIVAGQTLDDAAFGVGTEYANATGFFADEAATDSVDEGDIGIARMTLDRRQIMAGSILDDAAFGVGTEYVQATGLLADEASTDSVDEGDIGLPRMTLDRVALSTPSAQTGNGASMYFDADGDNTAQACKASAGNLYSIDFYNSNADDAYVQLFDVAAGSVTVGTTTPNYVFIVPGEGGISKEFPVPLSCATAITYACTTTPTGNGDPTTGLTISIAYK